MCNPTGSLIVWITAALMGLGSLLGCQGAPQRGQPPPGPSTRETAEPAGPAKPGAREPAEPPADSPPLPPPPVGAGTEAPPPAEPPVPELPEYVRVLERFDPGQKADVRIELTPPRRLAIDTQNVQRLWIDRDALPLARYRSIILQLDGQGIEWTPQSSTTMFERSVNGVWAPVKEPQP